MSYPNAHWIKTRSICNKRKHVHCTRSRKLFQCWKNNFLDTCFIHETLWYYTEAFGKAISYVLVTSKKHPFDFFSPPNRNRFNLFNIWRVTLYAYHMILCLLLTGLLMHFLHCLVIHARFSLKVAFNFSFFY